MHETLELSNFLDIIVLAILFKIENNGIYHTPCLMDSEFSIYFYFSVVLDFLSNSIFLLFTLSDNFLV